MLTNPVVRLSPPSKTGQLPSRVTRTTSVWFLMRITGNKLAWSTLLTITQSHTTLPVSAHSVSRAYCCTVLKTLPQRRRGQKVDSPFNHFLMQRRINSFIEMQGSCFSDAGKKQEFMCPKILISKDIINSYLICNHTSGQSNKRSYSAQVTSRFQ